MSNDEIKNLLLVDILTENPDSDYQYPIDIVERKKMYELYKEGASIEEVFSVLKDEELKQKLIDLFNSLEES